MLGHPPREAPRLRNPLCSFAPARALGAAVGLFLFAAAAPAQPLPPDPVEGLRQALVADNALMKGANVPEEAVALRKRNLTQRVDALRSLGDLAGALLRQEWLDAAPDPKVAAVDTEARERVLTRFREEVRRQLESNDPTAAAATAILIGEMAVRARAPGTRYDYLAREVANFVGDLEKLTKKNDPQVRFAAAVVLGKLRLRAAVDTAVPALKDVLATGTVAQRRAAAESLGNLIKIITQEGQRAAPFGPGIRDEVVNAGAQIVPAAAVGLRDADAEVRRLSAEAIQGVSAALEVDTRADDPAGERGADTGRSRLEELARLGRALTEDEKQEVRRQLAQQKADQESREKLLKAFADQAAALARASADPVLEVRLAALRALEDLAMSRQRMLRREALLRSVPLDGGKAPEGGAEEQAQAAGPADNPLRAGLDPAVAALAAALANDTDVRGRLAALDALEFLDDRALQALPALVKSLGDPDRFVRWASARTVGRLAKLVRNPDEVVPSLARLMADPDLDLRLVAASALEQYGPSASAAVPALTQSVTKGDSEIRLAAMRALVSVGRASTAALPVITDQLGNPDARVRRAAAATLGRFGPLARDSAPALSRAVNDPDALVREYASQALLSVTAK